MPGLLLQSSPCKLDRISFSKTPFSSPRPSHSPSQTTTTTTTTTTRPTIHSRRTLSYTLRLSSSQTQSQTKPVPPPELPGLGLSTVPKFRKMKIDLEPSVQVQEIEITPSPSPSPEVPQIDSGMDRERDGGMEQREVEKKGFEFEIPNIWESDREVWGKMVRLQREYHCYNSARLEAAVEAVERGLGEGVVGMPSRLCLDLLNEQLREKMRVWSEI